MDSITLRKNADGKCLNKFELNHQITIESDEHELTKAQHEITKEMYNREKTSTKKVASAYGELYAKKQKVIDSMDEARKKVCVEMLEVIDGISFAKENDSKILMEALMKIHNISVEDQESVAVLSGDGVGWVRSHAEMFSELADREEEEEEEFFENN